MGNTNKIIDMYTYMNVINSMKIDMIFKGALVLNAYLDNSLGRETKDIDSNLYGNMNQLKLDNIIKESVINANKIGLNLTVEKIREYSSNKSAGYAFYKNNQSSSKSYFTLDISIGGKISGHMNYIIGQFTFEGVTPINMMADKISAISTAKIMRRIKDMYDVYRLSFIDGIKSDEIIDNIISRSRKLSDFNDFRNNLDGKRGLKHAYNKYIGIQKKPEFDVIYSRVYAFVVVFYNRELNSRYIWSAETCNWYCDIE